MSRGIDTPPPPPPLSKADTEPTLVKVTDPASAEMVTNLSRSKENVIDTPSGQVKVRPYRSSSNAQLKAVLSFTPRVSSLDRENAKSAGDEFRGFFVLFWICEPGRTSVFLAPEADSQQVWGYCSFGHPCTRGRRTGLHYRGNSDD